MKNLSYTRNIIAYILFVLTLSSYSKEVSIEFNTQAIGGHHAPKHAMGVWITDTDNKYVRSMQVWGGVDPTWMLKNWRTAMGLLDTGWFDTTTFDGVTSATRMNHDNHINLKWDCKDKEGKTVDNGTYKVWFEMIDEDYWWGMTNPNEEYPGKAITQEIKLNLDDDEQTLDVDSPEKCFKDVKIKYPGKSIGIITKKNQRLPAYFSYSYNPGLRRITFKSKIDIQWQNSTLIVTDLQGREIARMPIQAHTREFSWDLKTGTYAVSSGVYLFAVRSTHNQTTIIPAYSISIMH